MTTKTTASMRWSCSSKSCQNLWWTKWKARKDSFRDGADAEGVLVKVNDVNYHNTDESTLSAGDVVIVSGPRSTREALAAAKVYEGQKLHPEILEPESTILADLLSGLMKYDPAARIPAQAILEHKYFKMTL